jgi:hypothetical protein
MSNISNEFKEAVKKWVDLDNERKNVMQKSNNIKKDMDNVESFIITFMESNNMTDKNILINDGKLCYDLTKTHETLTKKFMLDKLTLYFKDEEKAKDIVEYLYDNRGVKDKKSIKRKKN